jgi:hypothetical protein
LITEVEAIKIAMTAAGRSAPEVTEVKDPRNPIAKLMVGKSGVAWPGVRELSSELAAGEKYVWTIQIEGDSYPAGISAHVDDVYHFTFYVLDASNGQVMSSARRDEPFFQ